MNDNPTNAAQAQGRKIFEATMRSAQALIAQGVEPGAVVAGLLGAVTEIANSTCGPRETRRLLMLTADSCSDEALDA